MTIQSVSALLTDYARSLLGRGLAEGVLLGDWHFQVGTGGFEPLSPDVVTEVDPLAQALVSPVGGNRLLGRVLYSGSGASVSLTDTPGIVQVTGVSVSGGVPEVTANRWLCLSGSASAETNGTWFIGDYVDYNTVQIANPLMTDADAGPLTWEIREFCMQYPNARSVAFQGVLGAGDANGSDLGEVGIFCRVLRAPTDPSLVGQTLLYAHTHHVACVKVPQSTIAYHVVVQH